MRAGLPWPVALVILTTLSSASLQAQLCAGYPSLRDARYRATVFAASYTYATSLGASFTTGRRMYGTVEVARTRDAEYDASTLELSLEAGADIPNAKRRLALCPVTGISVSLGPHEFLLKDEDYHGLAVALGLGASAVIVQSDRLDIVATGGVRATWLTVWRTFLSPERITQSSSDVYGLVSFGIGVTLSGSATIRPGVTIPFSMQGPADPRDYAVPFGREEGEVSLEVRLGISFGRL